MNKLATEVFEIIFKIFIDHDFSEVLKNINERENEACISSNYTKMAPTHINL
jgi:hypothetical protein